jgi:hypothetical protein
MWPISRTAAPKSSPIAGSLVPPRTWLVT